MKNGFPAPNKELQQTKNDHLTGKAPYKFESSFAPAGSHLRTRGGLGILAFDPSGRRVSGELGFAPPTCRMSLGRFSGQSTFEHGIARPKVIYSGRNGWLAIC